MKILNFLASVAVLGTVSLSSQAALLGRDLDGNPGSVEAYYDTALDITWLADANFATTNTFGISGITGTGQMDWTTANAWIAAMNTANHLGISGWRLPEMFDIGGDGCTVYSYTSYSGGDCGYNVVSSGAQASEMASLYHATLGNLAYYDSSGNPNYGGSPHIQATGPFQNLGNTLYWYGQSTVTDSSGNNWGEPAFNAWYFGMPSGGQRPIDMTQVSTMTAWAVVDGDVQATVPVPAVAWLLGPAFGLLGVLRKRITAGA